MLKLLIAEDEIHELNALSSFFRENYSDKIEIIAECKNGKEAVDEGLKKNPDIAILDIQMPICNGLEVARILHENDSKIVIVMITAHSLFSYAKECISIGVKDYVLKPYEPMELRHIFDGIIGSNKVDLKSDLKNIVLHLSNTNTDPEEAHPVVRLAIRYLQENYMKRISMEIMSDDIGYSSSYISKLLIKYLNRNFNSLLLEIRCKEAVKLLASGDFRVNEVAYAVGFSDPNYFNKCFKNVFGKSPKKYSNTIIGNIEN